ncbi:protein translocase subunit SecF [Nocardia sp. CDC186]|uniref:Protein-export membrane protein SecF n=1 Tax=Nocardia implantans TaxID=3108168 RepID=A0ABU6B0A7_9NOCA|nr:MULTISPECIES: protein translocase subunit SecF [unclassified Nocardia]MBF6195193.1 protein translocase subunit SecF [Nocardia beijingensis]MEA3530761.1 protein translocase subunit SecF [Nocardia sp. CDC192]MEB3513109.1 protein translocase subunit SecF [Nocardia sp. CDC186]
MTNSHTTPSLDKTSATEITDVFAAVGEPQTPKHGFFNRLYTGTGAIDVIGKRRMWYLITAVIVLVSLGSILFRSFNFGIDFEGGSRIQFPAGNATTSAVEDVYRGAIGTDPVSVQTVGTGGSATMLIRSEALDQRQVEALNSALFTTFQPKDKSGNPSRAAISTSDVSETWGSQITRKAVIALAVFLVLVAVYIAVRFETHMAIAALAALFFDVTVTAGVYSLVGFEVTPATVIGILTILGFSLYDSVVVFDKVEENTHGILHLTRRTYGEQANLAVNQTLMRSINTALIGILPIVGLMVVAVWMLGVGTLKDLALVQLVGLLVGTYSSIFFATPLLVSIKERWGPVAAHTKKVMAKRAGAASARAGVAAERRASMATGREHEPAQRKQRAAGQTPRPGARPSGKRHKRRN